MMYSVTSLFTVQWGEKCKWFNNIFILTKGNYIQSVKQNLHGVREYFRGKIYFEIKLERQTVF